MLIQISARNQPFFPPFFGSKSRILFKETKRATFNKRTFFFVNLENIGKYHFLRQLWLFLAVKLLEISSNGYFPGRYLFGASEMFFFSREKVEKTHRSSRAFAILNFWPRPCAELYRRSPRVVSGEGWMDFGLVIW